MTDYLLPFGFAFFSVLLIIPILRKIAFKYSFVDIPNKRKIHQQPVPLLGGAAIFIGYIINLLLWSDSSRIQLAVIIGGSLVIGVGLIDDFYKSRGRELPALPKAIVQFICGLILFAFGIKIQGISAIFDEGMIFFSPGLSLLITLIWVIGLMNMLNFLDGLDGLASGISIISSMTLFLISFVRGQETTAVMSVILMGTSLGFLRYNFYPAKIFMGDSGSLFLGMMLAIISIEGAIKSATLLSIIMVIFALGVPIFDTILVFFKRWINHKPLYMADQSHAHHRLLKKGYSQRQAVTYIYLISLLFSLLSILLLFWFVI